MGLAASSTSTPANVPPLTDLTDDALLRILLVLPPNETGNLLSSCRALSHLAPLAWRLKLEDATGLRRRVEQHHHRLRSAEGDGDGDGDGDSEGRRRRDEGGARRWREELELHLRTRERTRPNIDRWGQPPHWYPDHPEPTSPFGLVRRCHDVTEFRISASSRPLSRGTYGVSWRVNSVSGFCTLSVSFGLSGAADDDVARGTWDTRAHRGRWRKVTVGNGLIEVGDNGGIVESKIWKNDGAWVGGILVDYLEVKKVEKSNGTRPVLLQSGFLTSDW